MSKLLNYLYSNNFVKYVDAKLRPIPKRYGKHFNYYNELLNKSQWWTKSEIEEYQLEQLKGVLKYSYENVPYYKKTFDERKIKPSDIKKLSDTEILPFTDRDVIRNNLKDLISKTYKSTKLFYVTTGGTSGKPLGFYVDKINDSIRFSFEWRQWNWMNYNFNDPCVVLRGKVIKNGISEYSKLQNYLYLSTYKMTDENLGKYLDIIENFKPKAIRAYPSSLEVLARYIKDNNKSINKSKYLNGISTTSENLFPNQRELIESVFDCKIFDKLGNSEQTTIAGQCGKSTGYHVFMEYSHFEIIDDNDHTIFSNNRKGEIVGTGFTNFAMPLIRYKTEDYGTYSDEECKCGRSGLKLLSEIQGRWFQEQIMTKNGNLIPITALNTHSSMFDNVKQFQYYQDNKNEIILKIAKKSSYSNKDTVIIKHELLEKLVNQVDLKIEFIDEIPRTDRGKYKFLIQKLKN